MRRESSAFERCEYASAGDDSNASGHLEFSFTHTYAFAHSLAHADAVTHAELDNHLRYSEAGWMAELHRSVY